MSDSLTTRHRAPADRTTSVWGVLAVVCTAVFMVTLDNLVVTSALASLREDLSASVAELGWIVNTYTLTFGVLMLLGAAAGDRFGRRRVFLAGLATFTVASAAAALATTAAALIAARAVQGVGGAVLLPLSLALLADAFDERRRGLALGIWSSVSGIGVALGPLVGGLAVQAGSWPTIFWLHVPVGIVLLIAARWILPTDSRRRSRLDGLGAVLATGAVAALLIGFALAADRGWWSGPVLTLLALGGVLLMIFVRRERNTVHPMLPLSFFRSKPFVAVNLVNVAMYFGMFGSIFLLAPFLQTVQGHSPVEAGVRLLPWTLMPLVVSPFAGIFEQRLGARSLIGVGMALQAAALVWIAIIITPTLTFLALMPPCLLGGIGMALVYPPAAATLIAAVRPEEVGVASGVMNSLRELAGACGIAVLGTVFTQFGGRPTAEAYLDGLGPAVFAGAAVLLLGAVLALGLPGRRAFAVGTPRR